MHPARFDSVEHLEEVMTAPSPALVDALRGVFLDGYGPAAIGREIATLTVYTVATFALSVKLFRWR